jgi:ferric-dicitrate binding protein FerR (iron transport regulator)
MSKDYNSAEFATSVERIATLLDGAQTPEQCEEVHDWLAADPQHVKLLVDHLLLHNSLKRLVLADDLLSYDQAEGRAAWQESARPAVTVQPVSQPAVRSRKWLPPVLLAAAASLVALLATPWFKTVSSATPQIVATVSDANDCQSQPGARTLFHGLRLTIGEELNLRQGLAELTFETGAAVVIEAPCRLVLRENAVDLLAGRISATVPRDAKGFTVDTPNSMVVDLGTEFGVNVDSAGATEVHVFKGEVISRRTDEPGQPKSEFVKLTTNEAIIFRKGSAAAEQFEANEKAFVRSLRRTIVEQHALAAPVPGQLLLWVAADRGVLADSDGRVYAWLDTLTAESDSIANNALQPDVAQRPQLVPAAIGAHPALRFDGRDDCLTTTPMTNGDNQTIAFVATFGDHARDTGQIINYNGPPQLDHTDWERFSVLQIRACRDHKTNRPLVDPFVYAGDYRNEELLAGRMEDSSRKKTAKRGFPAYGQPFVGVYVYDSSSNRAELLINGQSFGKSTAPLPAAMTSRKVIGRHGGHPRCFGGDIAELLIYDEGLDRDRALKLSTRLMTKYAIRGE